MNGGAMNSVPLTKLLALAERAEMQASHKLIQARDAVDACRRQLEDLAAYRHRPAHAAGTRVAAVHFAQASRFFGRVDEALNQQSRRIKELEHAVALHEAEWNAARSERCALEKLLEGAHAEAEQKHRGREQKQQDEAAAQTWLRNN